MFLFKLIKKNLGNIFYYYLWLFIYFLFWYVNLLEYVGYKINKNEIKDFIIYYWYNICKELYIVMVWGNVFFC